MDLLKTWWPVLVLILLVVVVVRRIRGEPLDLKDAIAAPVVLLLIGGRSIAAMELTTVDAVWLVVLSVVSLSFGVARSSSGARVSSSSGIGGGRSCCWSARSWSVPRWVSWRNSSGCVTRRGR